jgi:hypothetical protein
MRAENRRNFILGTGATAAAGLGLHYGLKDHDRLSHIAVNVSGPDFAAGHQVPGEVTPVSHRRTKVVIAGGGIAGLSAGWWLKRNGIDDFVILELEGKPGGNSRSGANSVSRYPLGAHYIPVPPASAVHARMLLEEMGLIRGYNSDGSPDIDEVALCHSPKERLLINGMWQEGLIPEFAVSQQEAHEIERAQAELTQYHTRRGGDGRPAFSSPAALSSRDPLLTALDRQSAAAWLQERGYQSKHLHWYLNYCTRDDFGTNLANTSAWALMHYFNARAGNGGEVMTWPEGNGHVVDYLADRLRDHIVTGAAVKRISSDHRSARTVYMTADSPWSARSTAHEILSDAVICAMPLFAAAKVFAPWQARRPGFLGSFTWAPWVVANLELAKAPSDTIGAPLSWDNVARGSPSLGYIVADHQSLRRRAGPVNITWYMPVTETDPVSARRILLEVAPDTWRSHILQDLEHMHHGIAADVSSLKLWFWPHAMIRPIPGLISSGALAAAARPVDRVYFAHSDLSGMSLFEEAQHHGVRAAGEVLSEVLRHPEQKA